MRRFYLSVVALAILVPAAARAQWSIGPRVGYALAMGDVDGTMKMSDLTSGQVPIQLDLGYRIQDTALTVGGYLSYGFGSVAGITKDQCDLVGVSCSTSSLRLGAQMLYSFGDAKQQMDPWIGLGLGYDSLTLKAVSDATLSGAEFLLQGGVDWKLSPQFNLGGFASYSLAQYSSVSGNGGSGTLADKKMHEWFTIGIRGSFGFGS